MTNNPRFPTPLILFLYVLFCLPIDTHAESNCGIADSAMKTASRIRGLSVKRKVPCRLQNKKEVEQYLRDTIEFKVPAEKLHNEERVYKLLGIIPADFKYKEGLIELYTSQLGGYYDPDKDYYAMAAWMPSMMQPPIAVHELVHALQDQHFDLEGLIDHKNQFSDALLARSALVEGDATAVMIDYSRELQGQGPVAKEDSVSSFILQNISGAMLATSLHSAPPALQALLIFPYVSGLNFAHALLKVDGYKGIDSSYKRPPQTTEEILHPEKYAAGITDFVVVEPPAPPKDLQPRIANPKPVFIDRIGEFAIATLLGSWLPPFKASTAATGWGGDKLALYELKSSPRGLLVWELHWDSQKEADEFFAAIVEAYTKRFAVEPVATAHQVSFVTDTLGPVHISQQGITVLLTAGG